jgi:hypothetical protein
MAVQNLIKEHHHGDVRGNIEGRHPLVQKRHEKTRDKKAEKKMDDL